MNSAPTAQIFDISQFAKRIDELAAGLEKEPDVRIHSRTRPAPSHESVPPPIVTEVDKAKYRGLKPAQITALLSKEERDLAWRVAHAEAQAAVRVQPQPEPAPSVPLNVTRSGTDQDLIAQIAACTPDTDPTDAERLLYEIVLRHRGRSELKLAALADKLRKQLGKTKEEMKGARRHAEKQVDENVLPIIDREAESARKARLALYNERFALIRIGAQAHVMKFPNEANEPCEPMSIDTFKRMQAGDEISPADEWLCWSARRSFEGVVFAPTPVGSDLISSISKDGDAGIDFPTLNLWRGFAVEGKPGDWSKLRQHLFKVVCRRNPAWFAWVMSWLADIVQDPANKKGTAIVVKGIKGTGKTKVVEWIAKLAPRNSFAISKESQVLGRFNAHHAEALFICMEEPFWAGDKAAEGVLKDMITGKTHVIEKKFVDPYQLTSCVRLWLCSNHDWVVPATGDERRFMVLATSAEHEKDEAWFAAIDEQMEAGGLDAMMFDLRQLKASKSVSLRMPPKTPWLEEQVEHSLPIQERWFYSVLSSGVIESDAGTVFDLAGDTGPIAKTDVPTTTVKRAFLAFAQSVKLRAVDERELGKFLLKFGAKHERRRTGFNKREYVYEFPSLPELRNAFAAEVGVSFGTDTIEEGMLATIGLDGLEKDELERWRAYGEGGPPP